MGTVVVGLNIALSITATWSETLRGAEVRKEGTAVERIRARFTIAL